MRRVLVIGATGLLGQYLMAAGNEMGLEMQGTCHRTVPKGGADHLSMDITDRASVTDGLARSEPNVAVLCAAMTNVDQCEREPVQAYEVNMEGALNVASACHQAGVRMVYISTDYVFNGLKGGRYHEFESPDPSSIYARSKLEGERVALDTSRDSLVCRVSVLYGWNRVGGKGNFMTWIIDSLRKGQNLRLYNDQFVSPTYAPAAARDVLELCGRGAKGIYHTSGPDCLDRHEIGLRVCQAFELDASLISPVSTANMPLLAPRPPRSCLAVDKAEAELGRPLTDLRHGLMVMRENETWNPE
jgi:dTDP-4-dehydrorhamnose reductase